MGTLPFSLPTFPFLIYLYIHFFIYSANNGGGILYIAKTVFPEREWLPWRFNSVPRNFWRDRKNQFDYLEWLRKKLNILAPNDWYFFILFYYSYLFFSFLFIYLFSQIVGIRSTKPISKGTMERRFWICTMCLPMRFWGLTTRNTT